MLSLEKTPAMRFSRRMVSIKRIQHIQDDLAKVEDISKLSLKTAYLNQAYILHLVAFWQVFVEDLVRWGFSVLQKTAPGNPLAAIVEARMRNSLAKFNTPSKDNIDALFFEALGVERITRCWSEQMQPNNRGASTLKRVLDARHKIAHTGFSDIDLTYESNYVEMNTLVELAQIMEVCLTTILQDKVALINKSIGD